jgi:hypothetical protein
MLDMGKYVYAMQGKHAEMYAYYYIIFEGIL